MDLTTVIPAELTHLLPLSDEMIFLLGVLSVMGIEATDFVYPEYLEVLSEQNPNDMKPCLDGTKLEDAYPGLVNPQVLQPCTDSEKRKVYYPCFDRPGFLRCLSPKQTIKAFSALARMLRKFFPEQNGEASMYSQWNTCSKHAGHVSSLCEHWMDLEEVGMVLYLPLDFVYLARHCAGYYGEINMNYNASVLVDTALEILDYQDFSSEESTSQLKLLEVQLLSLRCYLAIQICDYEEAHDSSSECLSVLTINSRGGDERHVKYLACSIVLHVVSFLAGRNIHALSSFTCTLIFARIQEHGIGYPEWREIAMHTATIGARSQMKLGEFDQANRMLNFASAIFDPASDSPVFKRAIEYLRGDSCTVQGDLLQAREHYMKCMIQRDYGTVMNVGQADYERTISIHYKLALIDLEEGNPIAALSKLRVRIELPRNSSRLAWKGIFHTLLARALRAFSHFAASLPRVAEASPEYHDKEVEKVSTEFEMVEQKKASTAEEFFRLVPWYLQ